MCMSIYIFFGQNLTHKSYKHIYACKRWVVNLLFTYMKRQMRGHNLSYMLRIELYVAPLTSITFSDYSFWDKEALIIFVLCFKWSLLWTYCCRNLVRSVVDKFKLTIAKDYRFRCCINFWKMFWLNRIYFFE